MSLLTKALEYLQPPPHADYWYRPVAGPIASGVAVDESSALTYSAVWCATRILSEGVAGLPLILYRRLPNGGKERATDQLLYRILHDEPNEETDSFQYFDQTTAWLVNRGNQRSEIQRNGAGAAVALWPIHPTRVRWKRDAGGDVVYYVRNDDHTEVPIPANDMLDVCGPMSENGIDGKGVITQAREAIGMGLATEKYGAKFFANSANPSAVLTHPGRLKAEAAQNMRASWKKLYSGENAGSIAILEEGVKYEKVSFSPEDAQFLTTRQFNITEIARWYREPPHMLYELSRSTNNNIEFQGGEFVTYSLMPWLKRIEKAINRKLIPKEQRGEYFVEFLVDALLRGDAVSRASANQIRFMNGALTINRWLEMENENGIGPDGDKHFVPANLKSLDALVAEEKAAAAANAEPEPPSFDDAVAAEESQPTPAPEGEEAAPVGSQEQAAATADIQATALNGAQIASMVQVAQLTVEETFNQDAARGMLAAAFPLLTPEQIDAIVDNLTPSKKPPAPAPGPFGGGPPKPEADEEPAAEDEEEPEENPFLRSALLGIFADTTRRMLRKEGNAAKRAAAKPDEFCQWLDAFYAEHELLVASAIAPACALQAAVDGADAPNAVAETFARQHCNKSKNDLLEAAEVPAAELEASVAACVAQWEEMSNA